MARETVKLFIGASLKHELRPKKDVSQDPSTEVLELKETRVFMAVPTETVAIESMYVTPVEEALIASTKPFRLPRKGWGVGFSKFHGLWCVVGAHLANFRHKFSFDISKMDAHVTRPNLVAMQEFIFRLTGSDTEEDLCFFKIFDRQCC